MYAEMLDNHAPRFGTVIEHAADPSRHALLFHCTAGKDRTGVAAALLLGALGVADADILDDYALTTEYRSGPRLEQLRPQLEEAGVEVEPLLPFFTAQRPVMELTLAGLRERHGSVDDYLTGVAGVAPSTLDRLRERAAGGLRRYWASRCFWKRSPSASRSRLASVRPVAADSRPSRSRSALG